MTKSRHRGTFLCILLLVVAGLFLLRPLFKPGFFLSDDGEWMIIRLSAFFQSLRDGQFPVRFLGRLNNSYGYPVANFLYPGFLYIGSVIHAVGFSFVDAVKAILSVSVIGASIFLFLWLKASFGRIPSMVGSVAFLFSPYLVFDLYKRGSVGEIFALLPAAASLYAASLGYRWLLAGSVGMLLLAHNSMALLFLPYILSFVLLRKDMRSLWFLFLGMGLAAFFWVPALLERQYVRFDLVTVANPVEYLLKTSDLHLIGPVFLVSLIGLWMAKKRTKSDFLHMTLFTAGTFFVLPVAALFWKNTPFGSFIQFPWRLLAVTSVAGSYLVAAFCQRLRFPFVEVFIIIAALFSLQFVYPILTTLPWVERADTYYTTNEATTTVADEYMPRWVKRVPTERTNQKVLISDGLGTVTITKINTRMIQGRVILQTHGTVQVNTVYYPGWGALVDDIPVQISYDNELGLIRFPVPSGNHRVLIEFRETPLRLAADMISLVSFFIWIAVFLKDITYKKSNRHIKK